MNTQLIIIQPTPFCNINCRYCYLPHRSVTKRIDSETLSRIFERLFSSSFISDDITILWHAGEPLVLPTHFYKQAFELISCWNRRGVHVRNSFQTNATLITQEWCDFFKEHDIQIGISLDGPEGIHNANRVDRAGRGTFDRVLRGIALLQENAIPYSIIAVITKASVRYPDELWKFFMDLRPSRLGFNVEEIEGIHKQSSLQTDEDIHQYQRFFKRILELRNASPYIMNVREIESLISHLQHPSSLTRSETSVPMRILSFDCNGNISTFSPELLTMTHPLYGNFIFGNVFDNTLEDVLTNENFVRINAAIQQGISNCQQTCDYFLLCGGGCPSNKISENGLFTSTETITCLLRIKAATSALLEYFEEKHNSLSYRASCEIKTMERLFRFRHPIVPMSTLRPYEAPNNNPSIEWDDGGTWDQFNDQWDQGDPFDKFGKGGK